MLTTQISTMARVALLGAICVLVASCDEGVEFEPGKTEASAELEPQGNFATEDGTLRIDPVEVGVCLDDIGDDDGGGDDDIAFDMVRAVGAWCLAKCQGYNPYWVTSDDLLAIGDWDSEDKCEHIAKQFCAYNFGKPYKDSCLGMPKDML